MLHRATWSLLLTAIILTGAAGPAQAQQPNLTYLYHFNFAYPVFPTASVSSTWPIALPTTLPGNSETIYLHMVGQNNGSGDTTLPATSRVLVDGGPRFSSETGSIIQAGGSYSFWNAGPISVRGGRHTFSVIHDWADQEVETDETDNLWGRQFILTPYELSEDTPKTRSWPPNPLGGVEAIVDGSHWDYNCDGFRLTSTGWWNAVVLHTTDPEDDYDLDLFNPSTGSLDGFTGQLAFSNRYEGFLDAVIINRNTVGVTDYDVGVTHYEGTGNFVVEHVTSEPANLGSVLDIDWGQDEHLLLFDTYLEAGGWVTVSLEDLSASGEAIHAGWANHDATELGLLDITDWETTDPTGQLRLHKEITTSAFYGLVVFRDHVDGGLPKSIRITIEDTPPDLVTWDDGVWHAPLVPTPQPGYVTPPVLPDTLHGWVAESFLNFSLENYSVTESPPVEVSVTQDGMDWYWPLHTGSALAPFAQWQQIDDEPRFFPGGRHTLTLELDYVEAIHEIYEDNNIYGEQYCWSPLELLAGEQSSHPAPGNVVGGFGTLDPAEPYFLNVDGFRIHSTNTTWAGVVLTQGPNSDYDLDIFDPLTGVKDGFKHILGTSVATEGETDYVVINPYLVAPGVWDIGVENLYGDEPYTVEVVESVGLPAAGTPGPVAMPVSHMLHLFDVYLEADLYAFRLDNVSGFADWSLALHPNDEVMPARIVVVPNGWSNQNGPGGPEWFTVNVPTGGNYCLAVCKADPQSFDEEGVYNLTILQGVSDVPDQVDLPTATALAGIHPNPFNPQTTISYDLAAPALVELAVYDVKGALVRRLIHDRKPAGRHAAVWDGRDDGGFRVSSGVYLAKFRAGAKNEVRKLMMVK